MGLFDDAEDKTEAPSSHRREEFRKKGTVALSRELLSVVVLAAVGGSFYIAAGAVREQFGLLAGNCFKLFPLHEYTPEDFRLMLFAIAKAWGFMVAPVFAIAVAAGLVASAGQVGLYISWDALTPKWERLDPIAGLGRLISGQGAMEAVKALFKILIAGWVLWTFIKGHVGNAALLYHKSVADGSTLILQLVMKLFFTLLFALSVVAGIDFYFQRRRIENQMRTSKREAKDEFKLREGDPLIKNRIRQIQRRIANRRMMEEVPKADVVVTNPTHFAVALQYDGATMVAPKVVAKGADHMAKRIRDLAKKHHIPLVENKPLARALYKDIEIGHAVPRELYKAVAEVFAFVMRLRRARA